MAVERKKHQSYHCRYRLDIIMPSIFLYMKDFVSFDFLDSYLLVVFFLFLVMLYECLSIYHAHNKVPDLDLMRTLYVFMWEKRECFVHA